MANAFGALPSPGDAPDGCGGGAAPLAVDALEVVEVVDEVEAVDVPAVVLGDDPTVTMLAPEVLDDPPEP